MMGRSKWAVGGWQWAEKAHGAQPAPASPSAPPTSARGITLIELLITITIIAIISAAILGTASAAMEASRRSRTQSIIAKLNGLLMERWDSYATRRVDVDPEIESAISTWAEEPGLTDAERSQRNVARGQMMADARMLALRELMKLEMPDRWSDVVNQAVDQDQANQTPHNFDQPRIIAAVPALTQSYYRTLARMNSDVDREQACRHQSAECLYMIIMYATGDGEARTHFTAQDIGDDDEDGAPEFLDGWGNPIRFVRWPAGFVTRSARMTGDADGDHDSFDAFRRDSTNTINIPPTNFYPTTSPSAMALYQAMQKMRARNSQAIAGSGAPELTAYRLVPLIYSDGPDELPGINSKSDAFVAGLDPYSPGDDADDNQLGAFDDDSIDNIHNHLIEY